MAGTQLNKPHKPYGRRLAAVLLAAVLLVPAWPAAGAADQTDPPKATAAERPEVTVMGNLVDSVTGLIGLWELSLAVKTPVGETFRSVSACLWYNDAYLTPVDGRGNPVTGAVPGTNYSTALPTIVGKSVTGGTALFGGDKGYLYLEGESTTPVALPAAERVVTVRFQVDESISYDAVNKVFQHTTSEGAVSEVKLFDFVDETADETCFEGTRSRQALWYESGGNSFYYVPAYDGTNSVDVSETVPVDGSTQTFPAPDTVGVRVRAADPDETDAAQYYDFLSNHLVTGTNILFDHISDISADGGKGITLDDVATVVFFDWDDSFLGATAVIKGADNRKAINDFVVKNMVHPDLQGSASLTLDRKDTYRGEYPCEDPSTGKTVTDGASYPLTNKLDYAFYGRGADAAYPYTSGWAPVTPTTMADTWTALSAGETPAATADFSKINDSVTYVKALYEPGTLLNFEGPNSPGNESQWYTCSNFDYELLDVENVIITADIFRLNADEYGVTKVKSPGLRMYCTLENGKMWNKVDLEPKDVMSTLFIIPTITKTIELTAVDLKEAGVSNYTRATNKSFRNALYSHVKTGVGDGYVGKVISKIFNDLAVQHVENLNTLGTSFAGWNSGIAADQFKLLNVIDELAAIGNPDQYPNASTEALRINVAKNRIVMYKAACGNRELTYQELVAAVAMNTRTFLTNSVMPNYLKFRVQTLMDAYKENENKDLSEKQIIDILEFILTNLGANPTRKLTQSEIRAFL